MKKKTVTPTSKFRTFFEIVVSYAHTTTYFKQKFIIDTLMTLFRAVVLVLVYVNVYRIAPQSNTVLPYNAALWSMGAYFIALSLNARRMYKTVSDLVYNGSIETYILRPVHLLIFTFAQLIGSNIIQSVVTSSALIVVLLLLVGVPTGLTPGLLLGAIVLLLIGVILEGIIGAIIGVFAIWIENSTPIYWIVDKFILLLGGSYVPVAFFPEIMKKISVLSPFGATRFASYAFYPDFAEHFWRYLVVQLFWVVLLYTLMMSLYNRGKKHIFINGS